MCAVHYQRWYRTGDPNTPARVCRNGMSEADRFWSQVAKGPGCWAWTGIKKNGYGMFQLRVQPDGKRPHVQAHRYAYEALVGPIAEGMTLDHMCHDVAVCQEGPNCPHRSCVNPAHTEQRSLRENIQRSGNGAKTHCKFGHEFTPDNIYINPTSKARVCRKCTRRKEGSNRPWQRRKDQAERR